MIPKSTRTLIALQAVSGDTLKLLANVEGRRHERFVNFVGDFPRFFPAISPAICWYREAKHVFILYLFGHQDLPFAFFMIAIKRHTELTIVLLMRNRVFCSNYPRLPLCQSKHTNRVSLIKLDCLKIALPGL